MIVVVDYGMGNFSAIVNMLDYLGFQAKIARDPQVIGRARHLILPGVGAFNRAMRSLRQLDLIRPLQDAVLGQRIPVLGICLGMQLLGKSSEEGQEAGLGWISARTVRIMPSQNSDFKVPHIGWSEVAPRKESPLFHVAEQSRFYFAHSYYMVCEKNLDVAATCNYSGEFCCAVSKDNIHGVQFHPEKSHRFGMTLFKRYFEGF